MEAELTIDFGISCSECGDDLDGHFENRRGIYSIKAYPCETCKVRAEKDSYDEGFNEGKEEAESTTEQLIKEAVADALETFQKEMGV